MTEIVVPGADAPAPVQPSIAPIGDGRVPHFRHPFLMTAQGAATVDQDSIDDVTQCVYAVLATEVGSRQEEPEFGVVDQTFLQGGANLEELEAAVSEWEPRASLLPDASWNDLIETVSEEVSLSE